MNNQNEPRRSRRLSTIIPASHWMSIGYVPMDAQVMENLMIDMNSYCEEGIDDDVKLRPKPGHFGENVVPYHDTMLPLWKRFSQALSLCTDEDFEELYIKSISMDIQVVRTLSDSIMNSHRNLKFVKLRRCGMNDTSLLQTFLAGCSRIKTIDLEYNEITSEGALSISDFISTNPVRLQAIFLNHNNLSDRDMIVLSSALKSNTYLLILELQHNDITEHGWKAIQKAQFDETSMNSLFHCNHKCLVSNHSEGEEHTEGHEKTILIEAELVEIHADMDEHRNPFTGQTSIVKRIRRKVILSLCRADGELFDLRILNDVPLQLMPCVLELIQEHTVVRKKICRYKDEEDQLEKDVLSRLFHVLRGWHLPLLFDNLHGLPTRRSKRKRGGSSR